MIEICPQCKEKTFIICVFGSICQKCYYSPPREGVKYHRG